MREIKFRAKRLDNGEWVYGFVFSNKRGQSFIGMPIGGFEVDPKTVCQYTGIKDKNDVEIYEGDILKIIEVSDYDIKEYLTPVIFEECAFVIQSGEDDYDTFLSSWCGNPNTTYPLFEIEVIGDIRETPELLAEGVADENL